jgi:hypothetical protein
MFTLFDFLEGIGSEKTAIEGIAHETEESGRMGKFEYLEVIEIGNGKIWGIDV